MSEYHQYIQELRAELKDLRRARDRWTRDQEYYELTIARLQHDRDRAEEIIMDFADVEVDEEIQNGNRGGEGLATSKVDMP